MPIYFDSKYLTHLFFFPAFGILYLISLRVFETALKNNTFIIVSNHTLRNNLSFSFIISICKFLDLCFLFPNVNLCEQFFFYYPLFYFCSSFSTYSSYSITLLILFIFAYLSPQCIFVYSIFSSFFSKNVLYYSPPLSEYISVKDYANRMTNSILLLFRCSTVYSHNVVGRSTNLLGFPLHRTYLTGSGKLQLQRSRDKHVH